MRVSSLSATTSLYPVVLTSSPVRSLVGYRPSFGPMLPLDHGGNQRVEWIEYNHTSIVDASHLVGA